MEEVEKNETEVRVAGKVERESVSNPIPIIGGKMKKRGDEYECLTCNKVGWFDFFSFLG